jgi:hypothetical protein
LLDHVPHLQYHWLTDPDCKSDTLQIFHITYIKL